MNKEKQIGNCKNCNSHEAEKIEEMAKDLCDIIVWTDLDGESMIDAEQTCAALYDIGYRKQGDNIVELPCNIGDEIWYINKNYSVQKAEVTCIDIRFSGRYLIATHYVWETEKTIKLALKFEYLNIDYWLTKDEAEKALAKMKGGAE